jgi:hypothetical protein
MISKVIRSALANAGQDLDVDVNRLVIADARVDEGPLLGGRARWRPRAMGRVYPILKRTSHLSVILEELEEQARETTRRQPRRKKAEPEADRGPETPEASEEAPEPEPEAEAKAAGSEEPNTEAEPTTEAGEPEAGAAGSAEPEPEAGEPEAGAAGSAEPTTEAGSRRRARPGRPSRSPRPRSRRRARPVTSRTSPRRRRSSHGPEGQRQRLPAGHHPRGWDSRWYAKSKKEFGELLLEDQKIRKFIKGPFAFAGIPKIEIERQGEAINIIVHAARPGILIGRKGAKVEKLRGDLERMTSKTIKLDIREINKPELSGQLVAENVRTSSGSVPASVGRSGRPSSSRWRRAPRASRSRSPAASAVPRWRAGRRSSRAASRSTPSTPTSTTVWPRLAPRPARSA